MYTLYSKNSLLLELPDNVRELVVSLDLNMASSLEVRLLLGL